MTDARRAGKRLRPVVRRGRWRVDYQGRLGTNSRWFRTRKEAFADYWTHREAQIYREGW